MDVIHRDVMAVLLERVFRLGLISKATYESARNSLAAQNELPQARHPERFIKEATADGGAHNTRSNEGGEIDF
jgi:hypothetical protein